MKRIFLALAALLLIPAAYPADVKISALPAATTLAGTEPIPAVQTGATVRTSPSALLTYVNSTQVASDIIAHWSGTCSASTVLLGNGACSAFPGVSAANPTASLGLVAINGSASTFMRSDAAPALNVGIAPTWTGVHTWSLTEPRLLFNQTGAGADLKLWDIDVASGVLTMRTRTDVDGAGKNFLAVTRGTTTAVGNVSFGNATDNPTYTFLGTAQVTVGGTVVAAGNLQAALLQASASNPQLVWNESDQGADLKQWRGVPTNGVLNFSTFTDAGAAGSAFFSVARGTTTSIASLSFGNATDNPTFNLLGSGLLTVTGTIQGNSAIRAQGSAGFISSTTAPRFSLFENDVATDLKRWDWYVDNSIAKFATLTDAGGAGVDAISITRGATTAIADLSFGNATNNPTFNFLGTGTVTSSGSIKAAANISFIGEGASPSYSWRETDQGTDLKRWSVTTDNAIWTLATLTDANATGKNAIAVTRGTTTAISNISFGNATDNNTATFLGTGGVSFNGGISVTSFLNGLRFNTNGTTGTAPANGFYSPGTNRLGFASNSTYRGEFDANGNFIFTSALVSAGTKFTTSGCSVSATAGGATAGTFTLGANSCSVVITMAGATGSTAPTGWTCDAHDRTAPTILIGGESSSTTTTATITIPAGAGATDVISFACTGF